MAEQCYTNPVATLYEERTTSFVSNILSTISIPFTSTIEATVTVGTVTSCASSTVVVPTQIVSGNSSISGSPITNCLDPVTSYILSTTRSPSTGYSFETTTIPTTIYGTTSVATGTQYTTSCTTGSESSSSTSSSSRTSSWTSSAPPTPIAARSSSWEPQSTSFSEAYSVYSKAEIMTVTSNGAAYVTSVLTPVTVTQTFSQIIEAQQSTATKIAPIIGGVVGGVCILACIFAFLFLRWRRKKKDRQEWEEAYDAGQMAAAAHGDGSNDDHDGYAAGTVERKPVDLDDETKDSAGVIQPYSYSLEANQYATMPASTYEGQPMSSTSGAAASFGLTGAGAATSAYSDSQNPHSSVYSPSMMSGEASEYGGGVANLGAGGQGSPPPPTPYTAGTDSGQNLGLLPGQRYSKAHEAGYEAPVVRGNSMASSGSSGPALSPTAAIFHHTPGGEPLVQHQDAGPAVEELPPTYIGMR